MPLSPIVNMPLAVYFFKCLLDLKQIRSDLNICYTQPTYQPNEMSPDIKRCSLTGQLSSASPFTPSQMVKDYLNTADIIRELVVKDTSISGPRSMRLTNYVKSKIMSYKHSNGVTEGFLSDFQNPEGKIPLSLINTVYLNGCYDLQKVNSVTVEQENFVTRFIKKLPLIGRIFRYFFKVEITLRDSIFAISSGNVVTMLVDLPNVRMVAGNLREIVDYLKKQQSKKLWGVAISGAILFYQLYDVLDSYWNRKKENARMMSASQLQHTTSKLIQDPKDETLCILCCTRARSLIFKPCLHYIICKECKEQIQNRKCPICRVLIEDIVYVIIE